MIKHFLALSCICILFTFCNNPSGTTDAKSAVAEDVHCYLYNDSSNIISLRATFYKDSVSGALNYDIYEKDKNSGTILGVMKGDLLVADYTFTSEGKVSVREVAFKKSGSTFIGGVGEMEEKDGKMVFKDTGKLNFDPNAVVLAEVDCNK
ncbi:MAG: hypothetical protein ABI581_07675 [Sediminibacterium sp.]